MLNSGLVNRIGLGWSFLSCPGFGSVPGQSALYDGPSKSSSEARQPPIGMSVDAAGLKHVVSSSSSAASLLLMQSPPSRVTWLQYSKCPISSEKAVLYECAAHGTRVFSLEVEYIGRNV